VAPWRVASVLALPSYRLRVRFNDGTEGEVDMARFLATSRAGVFAPLRDETLFRRVEICLGAVTWPGEIDLAPDAMYDAIKRDGRWVLD
jgi:hypothetical protein